MEELSRLKLQQMKAYRPNVELRRVLKSFVRYKIRNRLSYGALKEKLGENNRSLRRWIAGEDWPQASDFRMLQRFDSRGLRSRHQCAGEIRIIFLR